MANRINDRKKVLLPATMSPEIFMIVQNYLNSVPAPEIEIVKIGFDPNTGLMDLNDLKRTFC